MAVKLRLMRMGKKKQPTYRIVASDSRSPRDGRFIEVVGTYAPRSEPSVVEVDNARAVRWLAQGAQPTDRVRKLLDISGAWRQFEAHRASGAPVPPPVPKRTAVATEAGRPTGHSEKPARASVAPAKAESAPTKVEAPAEAEAVEPAETLVTRQDPIVDDAAAGDPPAGEG